MQVTTFRPIPELSPYITIIWLFESATGIPAEDSRVIVPNGHAKILIPFKNKLSVANELLQLQTSESEVLFTGLQQHPLQISSTPHPTATIGLEITPKGLCHLFDTQMSLTTNRALQLRDIFGELGKALETQLQLAKQPEEKIELLQAALLRSLKDKEHKDFSLLNTVLDLITNTQGLITIQEIESTTGYSKRYLDFLFQKRIGISPKSLAGILRFQKFYREWAAQPSPEFFKHDLHTHYYDQSHFIKDFKRYTGFTPQTYNRLTTDFGRAFYARR